ncbi:hypothetical protein ACFL3D_02575 [Candidatus Omnitrophota bacterium]
MNYMKMCSKLLLLVISCVLIASGLCAQEVIQEAEEPRILHEPNIDVAAHFERNSIFVGEHVAYELSFKWIDDGTQYKILPPHIEPLGLKVINVATSSESIQEGDVSYKVRKYKYDLRAELAGEGMVEALNISYYVVGNENPYFVALPAVSLDITEVPKPLLEDERVIAAGAGILIIVFLVIGIVITKKKRKSKELPRLPEEEALESLKEIQAIYDNGEYNEVIEKLSVSVCNYLYAQCSIDKTTQLTSGMLHTIDSFEKIHEKHRRTVTSILKRAEEARYSGIRYERHEVRSFIDDFRTWVEDKK